VTKKKHQPPLWLDMDFAEALQRFGKTNHDEMVNADEVTAPKKKAAGASSHPPDKPSIRKNQQRTRLRKDAPS